MILDCDLLHYLWIAFMKRTAVNMDAQVSLEWNIESFGYMYKSSKVDFVGGTFLDFSRNTNFHNGCTNFHSELSKCSHFPISMPAFVLI